MTYDYGRPNSSAVTGSRNRSADVVPYSGLCASCLDGCAGSCEVWLSSLRGREVLYPKPFGKVTAGATKKYPVNYSDLNIQGTCIGAVGVEADSDKAIFPAVRTETAFGAGPDKIKLKVPIFTGALGSTEIARVNWEHMAVGSAISGIMIVIGENIVGMDPEAVTKNGQVLSSPELKRRIDLFNDWQDGDYGAVLLQQNVEDGRLGSVDYAVSELGVEAIELKWGQGAKSIGGEVKLNSIERAKQLYDRGYVVLPNPTDEVTVTTYNDGGLTEFERHSRLGMVGLEPFMKEVERLRGLGAKYVTLKTGAYRPADLARAIKYASLAKLDLLTIDGAGGGTGMSPWRMMNEWGIPTIYLQSLAHKMIKKLPAGSFVPNLAIAGGFSLEDHIFKAIALGAPHVKAVCMGRATMIPAMVGKNIAQWMKDGKLPKEAKCHGETVEQIFVKADELKAKYGSRFQKIPLGAIAMYTYCDRLKAGLQQLMAGARKFGLDHLDRGDLVALTRGAAEVTDIPYVMDCDAEEVDLILKG
jgi:glutamate synthase domain-containing protein 2